MHSLRFSYSQRDKLQAVHRWCIGDQNKLVKQSGKMHCYHLVTTTTTNSEHYHKKTPLRSSQPIFSSTVLSQIRQRSIICPHTLDWRQLLRHFCRLDSHPEEDTQKSRLVKSPHKLLQWKLCWNRLILCLNFQNSDLYMCSCSLEERKKLPRWSKDCSLWNSNEQKQCHLN